MTFKLKGNTVINARNFVRVEGDASNIDMEIEDNTAFNLSGDFISISNLGEIRRVFPELAKISDDDIKEAAARVKGKSIEEGRAILQDMSAIATILTAVDWTTLVAYLQALPL